MLTIIGGSPLGRFGFPQAAVGHCSEEGDTAIGGLLFHAESLSLADFDSEDVGDALVQVSDKGGK